MPAYSQLTAVTALFGLFTSTLAGYTLQDDYSGSNFFSMFDFFTDDDPTHGYVDFVAQSAAQSAGLINTNNNQVYMGVDSTNVASGRGRKSVRVTSKASYNHALIVLDLDHMPGNACGIWPAFWTVGPSWPSNGEIDIIEGVNTQSSNAVTLHTGAGCSIGSKPSPNTGSADAAAAAAFSGSVATSDCDVNAQGQAKNAGCSISTKGSNFGNGLNAAKGGVYATEWTSDVIRTWYFPRGSAPSDLDSSPDTSSWGTPLAAFSGSCDIDSSFKNQQIVFDTTFCGDWAGQVWSTDATCSSKASTCNEYVQNNPEAFAEAFWTINSLKVYTGGSSSNSTSPASSLVPTASRSPVGTGISIPPVVPTANPSGNSTMVPIVPSVLSSVSAGKPTPTTTFATSTNLVTQSAPGQGQSFTWAGHSRPSRTWGGKRSMAEQTSAPISLPRPLVRSEQLSDNVDINMVRRHMHKHKRHGSAL